MKAKILELLRETDGYVSGQELCERFGVSRTAVWKAVNQLKKIGYEIEAVSNRGYHLVTSPDVINEHEIRSLCKTKWLAKEIYYYESVDSTNIKAKELAEQGAPSGTLVVAEEQVAGRGRRGRTWESPRGTGIFMSILLRPEINPNHASMLTLVAALAVARAIDEVVSSEDGKKTDSGESATGESLPTPHVGIKWPNDIVINGKKVCGILTEMSAQFDYISHIVVGIGINVLNENFPEELAHMATSMKTECGRAFHRASIIEKVMEHFEEYYEIFLETEDLSKLMNIYNELLVNRGADVKVLDPQKPYEGKALGITKNGELIVDTWEARRLVSGGEVSVRGIYGYV